MENKGHLVSNKAISEKNVVTKTATVQKISGCSSFLQGKPSNCF